MRFWKFMRRDATVIIGLGIVSVIGRIRVDVVPTLKLVVFGVLLLAPVTLEGVNVTGVAPAGKPVVLNVTVQAVVFPPKFTVTGLKVAVAPAITGVGLCAATVTVPMLESVNVV